MFLPPNVAFVAFCSRNFNKNIFENSLSHLNVISIFLVQFHTQNKHPIIWLKNHRQIDGFPIWKSRKKDEEQNIKRTTTTTTKENESKIKIKISKYITHFFPHILSVVPHSICFHLILKRKIMPMLINLELFFFNLNQSKEEQTKIFSISTVEPLAMVENLWIMGKSWQSNLNLSIEINLRIVKIFTYMGNICDSTIERFYCIIQSREHHMSSECRSKYLYEL